MKLNLYTDAFDVVNYLADVTCAFLFQEIHDLFKDYEIKYCYVDRNKRTGKNLKSPGVMHISSVMTVVRSVLCCVWSH